VKATCRLCGSAAEDCTELAPLQFARCTRCGFVFREHAEVRAVYEGGRYEAEGGERYVAEDPARRRDARVRLRWLRPAASEGDLLDVGAAGGAFVAEAAAAGFRAWGIEPTPGFVRHARSVVGVDVRPGTLEDTPLAPASLDVISMWHVLEHLPEPIAQLRRLAAALRPEGVVAIEVPNYGSAVARRMGLAWPSLEPDVHVSQFTPETLRAALELSGLEPVRIETVPITPYLTPLRQLDPRHVAGRAKAAVWLHSPRGRHPHGHELLRTIGRRARTR
jgi:2-polyprenyl-3-methyl-5-hydroxy-6-metoxy-1,4-benzoquinol methylase